MSEKQCCEDYKQYLMKYNVYESRITRCPICDEVLCVDKLSAPTENKKEE